MQGVWTRKAEPAHGAVRALVGDGAWKQLPKPVQARSPHSSPRRIQPHSSVRSLRRGDSLRLVLGAVARLAGAPLRLKTLAHTQRRYSSRRNERSDTQMWTRLYHEAGHLPTGHPIHETVLRPERPRGSVGAGIRHGAHGHGPSNARSCSAVRVLRAAPGPVRLRIPNWLTPGCIEVVQPRETRRPVQFHADGEPPVVRRSNAPGRIFPGRC